MVGPAALATKSLHDRPPLGRQVLRPLEQGQSLSTKVQEDTGTPRPGVSARQVLALEPDRKGQGVQPPPRLVQATRPPPPHAHEVLRKRRTPQGCMPRRGQRDGENVPYHGLSKRDAPGRIPRRSPRHPCHTEGIGCILRVLRQEHTATRKIP